MDPEQKKLKELFISNTNGTTLIEIYSIAALSVLCCGSSNVFRLLLRNQPHWIYELVLDNIFIVIPMVLSFTVFSSFSSVSAIFLFFALSISLHLVTSQTSLKSFMDFIKNLESGELYYISNYKANIQIASAICILAVDFNIFPRRFAKTEVYGISVMDCAVGAIVFSTALTSAQVKQQSRINFKSFLNACKSSLVLLALGFFRVLLVKVSQYQEHVTEYGVHWNFFMTLACIKLFATVLLYNFPFLQKQSCFIMISSGIIIIYQIMLSLGGLTVRIQNGFNGDKQRNNFIDANREGIFSTIGYLSIYFCGMFFGKQLIKSNYKVANKACWLALWFVIGCTLTNILNYFSLPISRQMANFSYFCFQISFNAFLLLGFLTVDIISLAVVNIKGKKKDELISYKIPFLYRVISQNLLVYFLLANVMTGAINFLINTLEQSYLTSFFIIYTYMCILNWLTTCIYFFSGYF